MTDIYPVNSSDFIFVSFVPDGASTKTREKLKQFRMLPDGWHYGEGTATPDEIYDLTLEMYSLIAQLGFTTTDAFPCIDGGVLLTVYRRNHYIECLIGADKLIDLVHEIDEEEEWQCDSVDVLSAKAGLRKIAAQIWNTNLRMIAGQIWHMSGSFTSSITIRGEADLPALHFQNPRTAEFQSFPESVLMALEGPSAPTLESTIRSASPENLQFFGSSQRRFYLTDTA